LPVLRRRHQEAFRRLVDHRHLPFAKRFIAMLHASGAASTLQRGGIPHTRHSCGCASVPPDPTPWFAGLPRAGNILVICPFIELPSSRLLKNHFGGHR
jgi:hypothetical protein